MSNKNKKWTSSEKRIKDLNLWDENPRFHDSQKGSSQKDLINHLLRRYSLEDFAKRAIEEFDLPQLEKIVVWRDKKNNKLMVLEGNRRVATYLLIANPNLIDDPIIKVKFEHYQRESALTDRFKLECLITGNLKQGLRFIDRKHLYSNNESSWGQYERDNYTKRTKTGQRHTSEQSKSIFRANLAVEVKKVNLSEEIIKTVLGEGFVTNLFRIIDNRIAPVQLGYKKKKEELEIVNREKFDKNLKAIVWNIYSERDFSGNPINSRTLNKNKQIEAYLKNINTLSQERIDQIIGNQLAAASIALGAAGAAKKHSRPTSFSRRKLIPCTLSIKSNKKLNDIYRELKDNELIRETKYSIGVLFRVFVEITCEEYHDQVKNKNWKGVSLETKLQSVLQDLDPTCSTNKRSKFYGIYKEVSDVYGPIVKLHKLIHDRHYYISENDLKIIWDNLEPFFIAVYNKI